MYDKIPVFDNFVKYTKLPIGLFNSSFAIKSIDDSMEPKIGTEDYIFIQQNAPLSNKDIGIFFINNEFIIRKFIIRKKDISLRPENKNYDEIQVNKDSDFYIIGKGDNLYICTLDGNIFFTGNIDSDENIDKEFPPLSTVFDILNGNIKTRVNAKPILGKKYYYVEYPITEDMKLNKDNFKICKSVFENYSDLLRWKAGNFFYSLEDVNAFVTK